MTDPLPLRGLPLTQGESGCGAFLGEDGCEGIRIGCKNIRVAAAQVHLQAVATLIF